MKSIETKKANMEQKQKALMADRKSYIVYQMPGLENIRFTIHDLRFVICERKLDIANRRSSIKIIDNSVVDKKIKRLSFYPDFVE